MVPPPSLAFRVLSLSAFPLGIVMHQDVTPSPEDWTALCNSIRRHAPHGFKGLVFTQGAAPNSKQRAEIKAALNGYQMPGAVLSSNLFVRAALHAVRAFNRPVRAFKTTDIVPALDYLGVAFEDRPQVYRTVQDLYEVLHPEPFRQAVASAF